MMALENLPKFQHFAAAQRIHCGPGSLNAIRKEIERLGCRRLVTVCGASWMRNPSMRDRLQEALGTHHAGIIASATEHSPAESVIETARQLKALDADAVLAVGGGSAIVTARAANIVLAEGPDIGRLCSQKGADGRWHSPRLDRPKLPQFVLPTTPTTACGKAGSAVLDTESGGRMTLFDPKTRAQAIFIDPDVLQTAPESLVLSASMNALAMAVEGLESPQAHAFSDALLMQSMRLLAVYLPQADTASRRVQLALSAVLCGQGTDFGGAGLASVLGHAAGHMHRVPNGLVNAVVLPHTMRFNAPATKPGVARIANALGVSVLPEANAEQAIACLEDLLSRLSVPRRLRDLGIPHPALKAIAHHAMDDWFLRRNPRAVSSVEQVLDVLQAAW